MKDGWKKLNINSLIDNIVNWVRNSGSFITFFVTVFLAPFLLYIFKNKYDTRKSIKVVSNVIYNVNGKYGTLEEVENSTNFYSNYIYHELTVESVNEQVITYIRLSKIKKRLLEVSDIKYDGGFYEDSQKFLLIAYNNGNSAGKTKRLSIKVFARKKETFEDIFLGDFVIEEKLIKSGNVNSHWVLNASDYYNNFTANEDYLALVVDVSSTNESKRNNLPPLAILFDRETGRFKKPPQGSAARTVPRDIPFFNLSNQNKKIGKNCSLKIENNSTIGFTLFVDRDYELSYKVTLKSDKKVIKNNTQNKLLIRIPQYIQENTRYFGDFYRFVEKHNPNVKEFEYTPDVIKTMEKSLVFNKYSGAEQFSKIKF